jgi:hypothetical protein
MAVSTQTRKRGTGNWCGARLLGRQTVFENWPGIKKNSDASESVIFYKIWKN